MKKKSFNVIIVMLFVIIGFISFSSITGKKNMGLELTNIEALASGESGSVYCPHPGYMCVVKYTNGTYETFYGLWS